MGSKDTLALYVAFTLYLPRGSNVDGFGADILTRTVLNFPRNEDLNTMVRGR